MVTLGWVEGTTKKTGKQREGRRGRHQEEGYERRKGQESKRRYLQRAAPDGTLYSFTLIHEKLEPLGWVEGTKKTRKQREGRKGLHQEERKKRGKGQGSIKEVQRRRQKVTKKTRQAWLEGTTKTETKKTGKRGQEGKTPRGREEEKRERTRKHKGGTRKHKGGTRKKTSKQTGRREKKDTKNMKETKT